MNPALATGIVRFIIARKIIEEAKSQGHGTFWRIWHGVTMSSISNKLFLLSSNNAGIVPANKEWSESFVSFWCMLNKPIGSKDIIIKEARGIVLAHLGAGASSMMGSAGGMVSQINQIRSTVGSGQKAGGIAVAAFSDDVRSQIAGDIYKQLNKSWRAGMWDCVAGTRNSFAWALDEALLGGCVCFSGPMNNLKIGMQWWQDKRSLVSLMSAAERKGRDTLAARQYVQSLCTQSYWSYSAETQALTEMS